MTGKLYHLDLVTLLEQLEEQSATLRTPPLAGLGALSGEAVGVVLLERGTIVDCVIEGPHGARLQGEEALASLRQVKEWYVTFEAGHHGRPRTGAQGAAHDLDLLAAGNPIARRCVPSLSPSLLLGFSSKERLIMQMVFTLVNGQRGVQQIKAHLHLSEETVEQALSRLRAVGAIEY